MGRRVQVELDAPAERVRDRAAAVLDHPRPGAVSVVTAEVTPDGSDAARLELRAGSPLSVPYFGWFVRLVAWWLAGRELRDTAARVRAELDGEPQPPAPRRPLLAPPVEISTSQATALATAAAVGALANFGGSLLTQDGSAVTSAFGRSDQALGFALAATRIGVLVALVASALADRYGRRRLLLAGLAGTCLANALAAAAPTFEVFTASQVLARACVNATLVVASIVVIEEAPDGARAFALSLFGLALGFGFGMSVVLLPLADLGSFGWRLSFLASALALLALPRLAHHLPESRRFRALSAQSHRRRWRDTRKRFGGRFLVLGAVAFLASVFSAPSSQLTNRYLTHTHHFSNSSVALFRTVTAGVPGFLGIVLAGRLAETRGRRSVSIVSLLLATTLQMAFFVTGGLVLWATAALSIVAAGSAAITVGALDVELFPTAARGSVNGVLLVCGVAGSAAGLLITTVLEGPVGGLGPAVALCGLAPLAAALLLLPRVPETAALGLDDISPTEG